MLLEFRDLSIARVIQEVKQDLQVLSPVACPVATKPAVSHSAWRFISPWRTQKLNGNWTLRVVISGVFSHCKEPPSWQSARLFLHPVKPSGTLKRSRAIGTKVPFSYKFKHVQGVPGLFKHSFHSEFDPQPFTSHDPELV